MATGEELSRYRRLRQDEIDSAALYRAMAEGESQPQLAEVYRRLAAVEERHAAFWEQALRRAGRPPG
ncbi:MAG: rubrerythrin family protein, partial [Actinomycetota bacterium]|nr:rubrerythrin family protein [Actinomycetota bacterium]